MLLTASLRLQLPLGLLKVLRCVNAMLAMVDKVEPRHRAQEQRRVSALARCYALKVGAQFALAVERLAGLDLCNHLPHVHIDLS